MKATVLIVVALCGAFASVSAQTKVWRKQSPCDNNFSVELPAPLYQVSWFEGKHGASLEPDEGFDRGGAAYVALEETPKKRQYGVVVIDTAKEDRSDYRRAEFGGNYFIIGGDDATPTSEKIVRVNGVLGREYVYAKEITEDTYTRGRIFYAGGRLYIFVFVASTAEDLMSAEATRFLDSFRIRTRGRVALRRASLRR
jgi:hypothetical protein